MRQEQTIRRTVKALGTSLRQFAFAAGISPQYLQDLMRGRSLPSMKTIRGLVAASKDRMTVLEIVQWRRARKAGRKR